MFSNLFVEVDSITYERYEVVRLHKTVHDKETGLSIPVSYAVLKSNGKPIATFEGVYFGLGNETDFGFAPLLGGETRQLIVSQTVPRGGRQWIVDLSAEVGTVFDSNDWKVGDEDVCVHDFDGDGVVELSLAITTFWGFGSMSMMESPLPEVVFKYDPGVRKYLPDDLSFARGLQGIEDDVTKIDPAETVERGSGPYLAKRLDILLRYAYAGKTKEAWAFFESAYRLSDRQEIIAKIKTKLESEPVYKFIQSRRSTANR